MPTPTGKTKATAFLNHIEELARDSSNRIVEGFDETEKELMTKFIANAKELIDHDEWGVGLENLITNLYEIDFKIDDKAVKLAKQAMAACNLNFDHYSFIEELNTNKS